MSKNNIIKSVLNVDPEQMHDSPYFSAGIVTLASGQECAIILAPLDTMRTVDEKSGIKDEGTAKEYAWTIPAHKECQVHKSGDFAKPLSLLDGRLRISARIELYPEDASKPNQPAVKW